MALTLELLSPRLAVTRLESNQAIPGWATLGDFFSITHTAVELSIVCEQRFVPPGLQSESDWRALKVQVTLDFSLTGILASLATPLAQAKISIFAVSTFDTDYILVKEVFLEQAVATLRSAGHQVV